MKYLILLLILTLLITGVCDQPRKFKILSVCADLEDVVFTHLLEKYLQNNSVNLEVEILYIGSDYGGSEAERAKLLDIWFLRKYDQIWIFDLNTIWSTGGRLKKDELNILEKYVSEGHVLVLGYNTFILSWSSKLEKLMGVKVTNFISGENYSGSYDIFYGSRVYKYNESYGVAFLYLQQAKVIAEFRSGDPAATISYHGNGLVVVLAFNPVREAIEDKNYKVCELCSLILFEKVFKNHPKPQPPSFYEIFITSENDIIFRSDCQWVGKGEYRWLY